MRIGIALFSLCLSACASQMATTPTPLDVQVAVGVGQSVTVSDASLRLSFERVVGDSRCPGDATCIQGGDAIVRIEAQSASAGDATFELHTGDMKPVKHGQLTIALVQLDPYPFVSRPFPPSEYRATLRITR